MTAYHLMYKHFKPETIELIKNLIYEQHFFKRTNEERFNLLDNVCEKLSLIYKIAKPELNLSVGYLGNGCYFSLTNTITINKPSLVTFLHEFKHAMQWQKNANNNEDIARGWSLSLFYAASPKIFTNSVKRGLIMFVNSEDLRQ